VSSLQTGVFAGPVGSAIGQHRFHPEAVVRRHSTTPGSTRRSTACSRCAPEPPTIRGTWSPSG
jgi:hypothetical protein